MKAKPHYLVFVLLSLILAACTAAQAVPEAGMGIEDDSPVNAGQPPGVTATGEGVATSTDAPAPSTATVEPASANPVDSQIEPVVTIERLAAQPLPPADLAYHNETYSFRLTLPGTWNGYQATANATSDGSSVCFSFPNLSPVCVLQVDVYSKTAWDGLTMKPPNYYLDENEQYVFAAGPYQPECVQLDDFQCARYREIPGILAGFVAESIGSGETAPILYRNETYGFYLTLPGTWTGFQATVNGQEDRRSICFSFPDHGSICVLQVDVFTRAAWDGLAMKPPNYYLDENDQFVFAAGPYPAECVQLDDFQCARYQELLAILAGFRVE